MRAVRLAAAMLAVAALSAGTWVLLRSGESGALAAPAEPRAVASQLAADAPAVAPSREPIAFDSRTEEVAALDSTQVAAIVAGRSCPDLESLLAEVRAGIEDLDAGTDLEIRLVRGGAALDPHCAEHLDALAKDASRPAVERLAALSLLRARHRDPVAPLAASERSFLWNAMDVAEPNPVLAPGLEREPERTGEHRARIAQLAANSLAALGDREDLSRLAEWLDADGEESEMAARAFSHAQSEAAADVLLLRLTDPSKSTSPMSQAMDALLRHRTALERATPLRDRAVQALLERWESIGDESGEAHTISRLLTNLDPMRLAQRWGDLLDQDRVPDRQLGLATSALVQSAAPRDLDRLDEFLAQGAESVRVEAASAVVRNAKEGSPALALRDKAGGALSELALESSDSDVRRRATLALRGVPEALDSATCRALLDDGAAAVREAAVLAAQALPDLDPSVRARLESAAQSDVDAKVRRAASQVLRDGQRPPGTHRPPARGR